MRVLIQTMEAISFNYFMHKIIYSNILPWKKVTFFVSSSVHLFQLYYLIIGNRDIFLFGMLCYDVLDKI
jgi:hypothetical protein